MCGTMYKKIAGALLMMAIMLGSSVTYYQVLTSDYKEMIRFSSFIIPQNSILIMRDDEKRVFKTREVTEKGFKMNYKRALKEKNWQCEEQRTHGEFICEKQGESVKVTTENGKLTLLDY